MSRPFGAKGHGAGRVRFFYLPDQGAKEIVSGGAPLTNIRILAMLRPIDSQNLGAVLRRRLSGDVATRISLDLSAMVMLYGITLEEARDTILEIGKRHGFATGIVDQTTIEVMTVEEATRLLAMGVEIDEIEHYCEPVAPDRLRTRSLEAGGEVNFCRGTRRRRSAMRR